MIIVIIITLKLTLSSTFYKKGGKFLKKIFILLLGIIMLFTSCIFLPEKQEDKDTSNQKFVGVWFTYKEIKDLCNNSRDEGELKENIDNILTELKKYKVNNVFLHTRAFDDCFYKSSIFNVSDYCKDSNGNLKFDILHYFIEFAKEHNISVHAWINPYRIRNDNNVHQVFTNSFAGKILAENGDDEQIIVTENSIYYNPAYPEVQSYILNGIREIVENYNVSGIHIDDYFYPTTNEKIDKYIYSDYLKSGGTLKLAEFRRNAVNTLISSIYSLVKSYNSNILVSISPSADIEKNYNNFYADIKLWAQNYGYADIIIPQIYYGFEHSTMPFNDLLNEWIGLQNEYTKIVIGLAVYKVGCKDVYALDGSKEWIECSNIIANQINCINNKKAYGWSYFSASYLYENTNEALSIEKDYIVNVIDAIWKDYVT